MRRATPVVLIVLLFLSGCGNGNGRVEQPRVVVDLDPDDPSILMRPFSAVINEFFFVPSVPGAPVHMRTLEGDTTVFELEQTARLRPDTD
jgi:hypothetical protein